MFYGVSYYPEQKNEEELQHDLAMIIASGINTVRMGEFAWCKMEPSKGVYNFQWLETIVDTLGKAGISTILCTPTACPPAWLVAQQSGLLYTDNRRIVRPFGGRRHYCYNHEGFRIACSKITMAMAKYFEKHEYVAGWQIDNEPAQEGTGRCCCPVCTRKFREWLQEKYGSIQELNQRSGGVFWSQEYTSFSQINPPVNSIEVGAQQQIRAFHENPTIRLDFERFSSDSQIEFQDLQACILRKFTKAPITTNATGLATNSIDYYKSTKTLDNYAFDYYPSLRNAAVDSFPYAFARGVKQGMPFWVLEFMSGGGHRLGGSGRTQPNPDALKQAVIHSFAHGAEMMLHFQYRTFPYGAEQLNYAIVDMDGVPRRRYFEMQETAKELRALEPLSNASFPREVALCVDYDTHWALRIKPINDPEFNYIEYCGRLYKNLERAGVNADVVSPECDWKGYRVLVLPAAFIVPVKMREKLRKFVENGGVLISTFLTSVKNENNNGYTETLPAGLTDVFGICVEEVEPVFAKNHTALCLELEGETLASQDAIWSELLSGSAKMVGKYVEDYKNGEGVISQHSFGKGTAWYFGTDLSDIDWQKALSEICTSADVHSNILRTQQGIEVVRRTLNKKTYYFIFNFTSCAATVTLPMPMLNFLKGTQEQGELAMQRNGYAVLCTAIQ